MKSPRSWVLAAIILSYCQSGSAKEINTIAFGSCFNQVQSGKIFEKILETNPDLFIWTGDIVYNDTTDLAKMEANYTALKSKPEYQDLRRKTRVMGVWDDHDYGVNDGGQEYPEKAGSQRLFLDFIDEPQTSARRKQKGIYWSYVVGQGSRQVKILLLDTRYHREEPGDDGDILGEEQWHWLETEVSKNHAAFTLLVSSISMFPDLRGDAMRNAIGMRFGEHWGRFPQARKRLIDLLTKYQVSGVIFVTGDQHMGVIDEVPGPLSFGYQPIEILSSGLTHSLSGKDAVMARILYRGKSFNEINFGTIQFDWKNESGPSLALQIRNAEADVARESIVPKSRISF